MHVVDWNEFHFECGKRAERVAGTGRKAFVRCITAPCSICSVAVQCTYLTLSCPSSTRCMDGVKWGARRVLSLELYDSTFLCVVLALALLLLTPAMRLYATIRISSLHSHIRTCSSRRGDQSESVFFAFLSRGRLAWLCTVRTRSRARVSSYLVRNS